MADRAIALIDCNHQLAVSVVGAGIDRGVGAIERLQELVAELVDEVGQVDVQGGRRPGRPVGSERSCASPAGEGRKQGMHVPFGYRHTLQGGVEGIAAEGEVSNR